MENCSPLSFALKASCLLAVVFACSPKFRPRFQARMEKSRNIIGAGGSRARGEERTKLSVNDEATRRDRARTRAMRARNNQEREEHVILLGTKELTLN